MEFGRIDPSQIALFSAAFVALITDLKSGRIFNWLTFPLLLVGLAYGVATGGPQGLLQSLSGVGVGLLLFAWIFWLGHMGGGDVKLLIGFGAWVGPKETVEIALVAVLLGGALALLQLLIRGRARDFFERVRRFFLSLVVRELEFEALKINRALTLPFGVPLSMAAVLVELSHPLQRMVIL